MLTINNLSDIKIRKKGITTLPSRTRRHHLLSRNMPRKTPLVKRFLYISLEMQTASQPSQTPLIQKASCIPGCRMSAGDPYPSIKPS